MTDTVSKFDLPRRRSAWCETLVTAEGVREVDNCLVLASTSTNSQSCMGALVDLVGTLTTLPPMYKLHHAAALSSL